MNTDIAQLVSVALYSPKLDESVAFFHDMLGLEISHREGKSVYMRAYEDFYQYSLKITEGKEPGLEEVTWRASSPEALEKVARQIEASGLGIGWTENDYAHGRAYKFKFPDGHNHKVLWDLDYFKADDTLASKLRSRPSKGRAKRPADNSGSRLSGKRLMEAAGIELHRPLVTTGLLILYFSLNAPNAPFIGRQDHCRITRFASERGV